MAPRLALSKIQLICDMIKSDKLTTSQIASTAEYSRQSVYCIRSNLNQFKSARAPPIRAGQQRIITPPMLEALCDHLLGKPTSYLDEMAVFLWDEFDILVTTSSSPQLVGQRRKHSKKQKNKIKTCKIIIFIIFLTSLHIS
jgi:hypothetical protein